MKLKKGDLLNMLMGILLGKDTQYLDNEYKRLPAIKVLTTDQTFVKGYNKKGFLVYNSQTPKKVYEVPFSSKLVTVKLLSEVLKSIPKIYSVWELPYCADKVFEKWLKSAGFDYRNEDSDYLSLFEGDSDILILGSEDSKVYFIGVDIKGQKYVIYSAEGYGPTAKKVEKMLMEFHTCGYENFYARAEENSWEHFNSEGNTGIAYCGNKNHYQYTIWDYKAL